MLHRVVDFVLPKQCSLCDTVVATGEGLCAPCWADTLFIDGACCDLCGAPLPGEMDAGGARCDDCLTIARPWDKGRSAMVYAGTARQLVLGLKHGDRLDIVPVLARYLGKAAAPMLTADAVFVPVPIHWTRLLHRKYNQSAVLAIELGKQLGRPVLPEGMVRIRRTRPTEDMSVVERYVTQQNSIRPHPTHGERMRGRNVVIVDDVMTSGATLAAATEAAQIAGAKQVCVLTLARAVKDA